MKTTLVACLALACLSIFAAPRAAQDRLILVDDGPFSAEFTTIQGAIDAASDGDVILVRPGTYDGFTIDGKGVSVVSEKPGDIRLENVSLAGRIEVRNLSQGQTVHLRGVFLRMLHSSSWSETKVAVNLHDNAGTVLFEDCEVYSSGSNQFQAAGPAVRVRTSQAFYAVRSTLLGGIVAEHSSVFVYDSDVSTADGSACGFGFPATHGRPAIRATGGEVLLAGSVVTGSAGGDADPTWGCCAYPGGSAVELTADSPSLYILDSQVEAGPFGDGTPCAFLDPPDVDVQSGQVVDLPGASRSAQAARVTPAGGDLLLTFDGEPGDVAFLGWSATAAPVELLSYGGWLLPNLLALQVEWIGPLDPDGKAAVTVPVPALSGGLAALPIYSQAVFAGLDAVVLAPPSAPVLVELEDAVSALGLDDCDGDGVSDFWDVVVNGERDDDLDLVPNGCDDFARLYVDDDGPADPGPGDPTVSDPLENGSAAHPFDTIQEALDVALANPYHVVLVAAGTYTGVGNRDLTFNVDLTIRGEGAATTVIDCQGVGRAFDLGAPLTNRARIEGFTIRNGSADEGGAVRLDRSSPVFADCAFEDNQSTEWIFSDGGAVFSFDGSPAFFRCEFRGNVSAGRGGGMYLTDDLSYSGNYPDDILIEDCVFEANVSTGWVGGGGLATDVAVGGVQVRRSRFLANTASEHGGGMVIEGDRVSVESCFFSGNRAEITGGGLATTFSSRVSVRGSTFVANTAATRGGAIDHGATHSFSVTELASTILWGNGIDVAGPGGQLGSSATLSLIACDIQGGIADVLLEGDGAIAVDEGNLDVDPLFAGAPTLGAGSPCIDAGDAADVPGVTERDLEGDPRRIGAAVDIGADEVSP